MSAVSRTGNIFEDVAIKAAVMVATTGNIALNGLQTIDGIAVPDGARVLAWQQSDGTQDGIWQASAGPWIRTADARNNTDFVEGTLIGVTRGDTHQGQLFQVTCQDNPIVIDTSELAIILQSDVLAASRSATSNTSQAIGLGAKTFATQSGKAFRAKQWVLIYSIANPDNAMLAQISSYASGSLVTAVAAAGGSGTHTDWAIVLMGSAAAAGLAPPVGTGNVTGPGSSSSGHLAVFADGTGKTLADFGAAPGTLATRNALAYGDAGTASIPASALSPGSAPLPFTGAQPADNLRLSNDGTNPTRDVGISKGRVRDDSDATNLHLAAAMVKRLDTAWAAGGAVGAAAGVCDSGSKGANETWHIFLIAKRGMAITSFSRTGNVATVTSAAHGLGVGGTCRVTAIGAAIDAVAPVTAVGTNTVSFANTGPDIAATAAAGFLDGYDIVASKNYAAPTLPTGWTVKQCLGSVLTDGSGNVLQFAQFGDVFMQTGTPITELNAQILTTSPTNLALKGVPNGVSVLATLQALAIAGTSTTVDLRLYSPLQGDIGVDVSNNNGGASIGMADTGNTNPRIAGTIDVVTNTSQQVRMVAGRSETVTILSLRYRDPRRRFF